ncbi:glutathionylspermidine synthase family protein [Salinicola avicenniae]|uniref:glutathionylspermidine synthase family protein n=1 Tax=Salinicola avicenniae TaxID=2916836 RepID=UPI0035B52D2C
MIPRQDWCSLADALGFHFHSIDGAPYWDESLCYAFTLRQIEDDLEAPTGELHEMCLALVEEIVASERLMQRIGLPPHCWDLVRRSWLARQPSLYGRMDFAYDGRGPAKLYEYNADTPTALYEAALFQWVWLEQCRERGLLPAEADQFNAIQEALIANLAAQAAPGERMHFACCEDHIEDMGTVTYLADCAAQAGLSSECLHIETIGHAPGRGFVDASGASIERLFKLYPWEWMFDETFGRFLETAPTRFVEPPWKAILSNKAILPLLWERHPGHPNLIPACFADTPDAERLGERWVAKPFFSREGANISVISRAGTLSQTEGPYHAAPEYSVLQAWTPPPTLGGQHPIVGSWIVGDTPVGIGIREDAEAITQDSSRFVPHCILE